MNYVFFIPDEMRAESVSCYGHPLVRMPNYDRVAHEGVRFEQCHVQHTVCSPSRCSLMTGWYPHVSGHRTLWHLLRPHEPNLLRYLKEAGYHIEWYGKNDLYAAESFPLSVHNYADPGGAHAGPNAHAFDEPAYYAFDYEPFPGGLDETGDMRRVQAGIDFLRSRRRGDPPFVLYLPLSMPHPPYAAPEPYHSMYVPDEVPSLRPADLANKPDFMWRIREYRRLDRTPAGLMERLNATYLGMNSYVDWVLGRLLDALDETGLAEDTLLTVTSDHGDWAGDYGLVEKWPSALDDTLTRVPLIVRGPHVRAGHVVREPVELMDVMPTVMELAGVPVRHTHFARSLVPQLQGAPGDPDRAVFAEGGYDPHEPHAFEGRWSEYDIPRDRTHIYWPKGLLQQEHPESVCRSTMLRTARHKLVWRTAGECELYDLEADPRELRNVYTDPAYSATRAELEARLLGWYVRTSDVVPVGEDPRGLPRARG